MFALPKGQKIALILGLTFITLCWLASGSGTSQAQSYAAAPHASVKGDSLAVYSEMRPSGAVVKSLKKGDEVILDFEIRGTTGRWCSVRLPGQASRLGYVQCEGLERVERPVVEQPLRAEPTSSSVDARSSTTRRISKHSAGGLPLTPPSAPSATEYDKVAGLVVRNDLIDLVKLAELDAAAPGAVPPPRWLGRLWHTMPLRDSSLPATIATEPSSTTAPL